MNKLQPAKKSFEHYLRLGYEYNFRKMNPSQLALLNDIAFIDHSILILDDIFDQSKTRNGKPCMYIREGIQKAILTAEILKSRAIESLTKLMEVSKTHKENQIQIFGKLNEFFKNIYLGEKIDFELGSVKRYDPSLIKKYFEMIHLFTGCHIQFGLELGQLISNKKIDSDISKIAISLGAIRQIYDDFQDYYDEHHEPCGDLINHSNRLPELLFNKFKGNITQVEKCIKLKDYTNVRRLVLNQKVRKELHKYCEIELAKIKKIKTDFEYDNLIEDFDKILTK